MCGRFFLDAKNRKVDRILAAVAAESPGIKAGEIFPGDVAPVLRDHDGHLQPVAMGWGRPRWDGKGLIFNARAETALAKPMFAKALKNNPLIVPASGFYEWQPVPGKKSKKRFLFQARDGQTMFLAGFWNNFLDGLPPFRFTILTTEASEFMRPFHDRMPVLIKHADAAAWCQGRDLPRLLAGADVCLTASQMP